MTNNQIDKLIGTNETILKYRWSLIFGAIVFQAASIYYAIVANYDMASNFVLLTLVPLFFERMLRKPFNTIQDLIYNELRRDHESR